eukprot:COSAG04_NODE_2500_length_4006_cov_6.400563_2_plen_166_part_00
MQSNPMLQQPEDEAQGSLQTSNPMLQVAAPSSQVSNPMLAAAEEEEDETPAQVRERLRKEREAARAKQAEERAAERERAKEERERAKAERERERAQRAEERERAKAERDKPKADLRLEDVAGLPQHELRKELRVRGLGTTGVKRELVERLEAALLGRAEDDQGED